MKREEPLASEEGRASAEEVSEEAVAAGRLSATRLEVAALWAMLGGSPPPKKQDDDLEPPDA